MMAVLAMMRNEWMMTIGLRQYIRTASGPKRRKMKKRRQRPLDDVSVSLGSNQDSWEGRLCWCHEMRNRYAHRTFSKTSACRTIMLDINQSLPK